LLYKKVFYYLKFVFKALEEYLPHHLQLLQADNNNKSNLNPFDLEARYGGKWVVEDEV
jgi:hypothetical protein